jgi:hypothetical protein
MKCFLALSMLLIMNGTPLANTNVNHFRVENGKIVVAQSYCAICADNRTSCQLGCNGAGACIQSCDDRYRDCREQNCGSRGR